MKSIADLRTLADTIYSVCYEPPGILINEQLDAEVLDMITIQLFTELWRDNRLSAKIKVHILEKHLIMYLLQF